MLRIFVYSLLLVNILLIAMRMLQPEAEEPTAIPRTVSPASNLPSIELAEELPENPALIATVEEDGREMALVSEDESRAVVPQQQSMACIQVGPIETESSLADLRDQLSRLFERVQSRETRSIVDKGFWVYLPSFATRAQASQVIGEMSALGARDFYIVPDGSMANAISLGVYDRRERAEQRRQQLTDLGLTLDIMIEPQTEIETKYYLEAGPVNALNPTLIELSNNNPDTQQIQVDCSITLSSPDSGAESEGPGTPSPDRPVTGQN